MTTKSTKQSATARPASGNTSGLVDHPWAALERAAAVWGDADALVFPHQQKTLGFKGWQRAAVHVSNKLHRLGVGAGDHVGLYAENRIEWPIVQLALAALGAVLVPLNTHYRRDDLQQALALGDVTVVITSQEFRGNSFRQHLQSAQEQLTAIALVIDIAELLQGFDEESPVAEQRHSLLPALPVQQQMSSRRAVILFTSGTTGIPKGAELSHQTMMINAAETAVRLGVGSSDRWVSMIPLFHCAGCIMNLLGCLHTGAAYIGVPSFDAGEMFEVIATQRCTHKSGVPTSWLAMLNHSAASSVKLSSLRGGTCGGADVNTDVMQQCAEKFDAPELCQVYGQTESGTLVSCSSFESAQPYLTAGPALPCYTLRVVDPVSGKVLSCGDIGEVQANGPCMDGYYKNPQATAQTITSDGWLRTGDLGFLDMAGNLVISGGRLRDMIIRGGENIYPAEVELCLSSLDGVEDIAVVGLPDDHYGEIVAAVIKLKGSTNLSVDSLRDFALQRLAKFKVPVAYYGIEQFPLTASGKIRKVELEQLIQQQKLERLT